MQDPTDIGKSRSTSLHCLEQICVLKEVLLGLGLSVDKAPIHTDQEDLQVATQTVGMPLFQLGTIFGH